MASRRSSAFVDPAHATTAAAGDGLDEDRESMSSAAATSASTSSLGSTEDSTGTSASRAAATARALLPVSRSTSTLGPTKVMPASAQACASAGFSDRNP